MTLLETYRDLECNRFDLFGALYLFCVRHHSGEWSRGYRLLSRLDTARYSPGLSIQNNRFESEAQLELYRCLYREYRGSV